MVVRSAGAGGLSGLQEQAHTSARKGSKADAVRERSDLCVTEVAVAIDGSTRLWLVVVAASTESAQAITLSDCRNGAMAERGGGPIDQPHDASA